MLRFDQRVEQRINWLHISDFHLKSGISYDRDVVLKSLVDSVRELRKLGIYIPDVIFATGDIAFSGQEAEYDRASKFFDDLLDATLLERSNLFVIPGNHDVNRAGGKWLKRTIESLPESFDFFTTPADVERYWESKLGAYVAWYDKYFEGVRSIDKSTSCAAPAVIDIAGWRLVVASINSALFSIDEQDHSKLWIGRPSLEAMVEAIPTDVPALRIALIHHPIDWISDIEQSNIAASLRNKFDLILRGHLHTTDADSIAGVAGTVLHIASGAAYQGIQYPNKIIYGSADFRRGTVTISPFRYEDTPRTLWVNDPSIFPRKPGFSGEFDIRWKGGSPPEDGGGGAPKVSPLQPISDPPTQQLDSVIDEVEAEAVRTETELKAPLDTRTVERIVKSLASSDLGPLLRNYFSHPTELTEADSQGTDARDPRRAEWDATINIARDLLKDGKAKTARTVLMKIRSENEGLPDDVAARVAGNLAACAWELDEVEVAESEAATALELQPDNPKSIGNVALIALIRHDFERAKELSLKARAIDPKVENGASVFIQACARLGQMTEVREVEADSWVLEDAHCVMALAQAYLDADDAETAKKYAACAAEIDPDNPYAHFILSQALLYPAQQRLDNAPPARWRMDESVLEAANGALVHVNKTLQLVEGHENFHLKHMALISRAGIYDVLGRDDEAFDDCAAVIREADGTDSPTDAALTNKGLILLRRSSFSEAAICFEAVTSDDMKARAAVPLASCYKMLHRPADVLTLLQDYWANRDSRVQLVDVAGLLLDAHDDLKEADGAKELEAELLKAFPSDPLAWCVAAEHEYRVDRRDVALAHARIALELSGEGADDVTRLRLGQVLLQLGEYADASRQFAPLAERGANNPVNREYVVSLYDANDLKTALDVAQHVRDSGTLDPVIGDIEAIIREEIGDRKAAIDLHKRLSAQTPASAHRHTLQATYLLIQERKEEEARELLLSIDDQNLPSSPALLMKLAELRMMLGIPGFIPVAYQARRKGFANPDIHRAYIGMMLRHEQADGVDLNPGVVAEGTAVTIGQNGKSQTYIIESEGPDRARGEVCIDDPVAQRLVGRSAGDQIVVKEGPPKELKWLVQEVKSKYVHAVQESMQNFENWFPDRSDLAGFHVSEDDISELISFLNAREESVGDVYQHFVAREISVYVFARAVGRTLFQVWSSACSPGGTGIHACTPHPPALQWSTAKLSEAKGIVLDPISICTVVMLGIEDKVSEAYGQIWIAQHTSDEFHQYYDDALEARPHQVMSSVEGKPTIYEVSATEIEQDRAFLERVITFIETKAEVEPVHGLLDIDRGELVQITRNVGKSVIASAVLAKDKSAVFICDDERLRLWAQYKLGVPTGWSQSIIENLGQRELMSPSEFGQSTEMLIERRYEYPVVNARLLLWMLEKDDLKLSPNTERAISFLESPKCADLPALFVLCGLITYLWGRHAPRRRAERLAILSKGI